MSALASPSELRQAVHHLYGFVEVVREDPHPMRSSCPLTQIVLVDRAGSQQALVMKDLGRRGRHRVPAFLRQAEREIVAYREWLPTAGLDTARFAGALVEPRRDRYWLFLEAVEGVPLWQSQTPGVWTAAAHWLGRLHSLQPPSGPSLLRYDAGFFERWPARATCLSPEAQVDRLEPAYRHAVSRLLSAPAVFVHGDFYPSNILVRDDPGASICPVDFELAGTGPGVLDLAALMVGLPDAAKQRLRDAYLTTAAAGPPPEELDELLACARLQLAVRWLGWLANWKPPDHQRFDWAGEAHAAARELEAWL